MRFDTGRTLHTHLRVQGSWTVTAAQMSVPPAVMAKVRVRLGIDDGCLWGIDVPVVDLVDTALERNAIGHLGPDPLRPYWDPARPVGD